MCNSVGKKRRFPTCMNPFAHSERPSNCRTGVPTPEHAVAVFMHMHMHTPTTPRTRETLSENAASRFSLFPRSIDDLRSTIKRAPSVNTEWYLGCSAPKPAFCGEVWLVTFLFARRQNLITITIYPVPAQLPMDAGLRFPILFW